MQNANITTLRLEIDSFINSTRFIRQSREVSLAHTNLQRSKMWLGKAQGELGNPTPYTNSENPTNKVIEPQADHTENNLTKRWNEIEKTHTARVKDFRFVCQETIDKFKKFFDNSESAGKRYDQYLIQSLLALEEAKMWFGWELDRIRLELENAEKGNEPQTFYLFNH